MDSRRRYQVHQPGQEPVRPCAERDSVWLTIWITDMRSRTLNLKRMGNQDSESTRYPAVDVDTDVVA